MFKHIVLPLDFTDKNDPAIETTVNLAGAQQSRVTLLHVIEAIEGAAHEEIGDFYQTLEARAERALKRLQTDLVHRSVDVEIAISFGNRAEEIVRFATESAVDLIVMSSRPFDPDAGFPRPWPTISHKVAVIAQCPVLLVR